ncbi:hypothetical protein GGR20_002424 [Devosia subaequoris]|uniref:DUF305 domain-containing protein n=1 Tax=Devosia subaequoris TaxID=395930 RepID=A0A7W6IPB7_9HYPH|nr:hypothetical protein [Devosia subaequoris]
MPASLSGTCGCDERLRLAMDARVRELADEIIAAQVREIDEMKSLIAGLEANPPPATAPVLTLRPTDSP